MIADLITKMYEDPKNAPTGLELGVLESSGDRLAVGPMGTETEFALTAGHVGLVLVPGDHKIARFLAAALLTWATFAEREVAEIKERIAGRGKC